MSGISKLRKRDIVVAVVFLCAIFGKFAYKAYQQIQTSPSIAISFANARAEHQTKLLVSKHLPPEPLPEINRQDILEHTSYQGPLGAMGGIATPLGESGAMKPAVVWVNCGFTGISTGDYFDIPTNDQGIAGCRGGVVPDSSTNLISTQYQRHAGAEDGTYMAPRNRVQSSGK